MGLSEVIMMFGMFILYAWIGWIIIEWRKSKHKSNLLNKIIDKYSDVKDLNQFLANEEGHRFLSQLSIDSLRPKEKLLSSIARGVVLPFLGLGLIFVTPILTELNKDAVSIKALGILIIVLGIGFLISAVVSYQLSKKWGLLDPDKDK